MVESLSVGGVIALVLAVFKYVDHLTRRKLDAEVTTKLKELDDKQTIAGVSIELLREIHQKYDDNGIPLVYVPRGWADVQEKIVNACVEISSTQKQIAVTLDRLEGRLGRS